MAKSKKNAALKTYTYLENWSDGTERIVLRKAGKFVDNVSLTSLRKAKPIKTR
jgi:hypothetical protein